MDQNPQETASTPKQQVVERVRQATNVLVTVRSNPSVDELAATIGLTLMLNKLGKHATAVFSGTVPSTLEFLKPEETLEANTDSLRDFIISLDKGKADKLRYKVEENVVRIFITPYRTSITDKDLEFTQGDFNVDVVLALGVTQREELDQAITSHGRILHDATVVAITAGQRESTLGNINWQDAAASSLSEMLVSVSEAFQGGLIDAQMATAFLTGIVAETERFSNPKTTPKVMTMAAQLMAAGANQQLIANELQKDGPIQPAVSSAELAAPIEGDGALSIDHEDNGEPEQKPVDPLPNAENSPNQQFSEPFIAPPEEGQSFNPLLPHPGQSDPGQPAPQPPAEPEVVEPILPPPPEMEQIKEGEIHIDNEGNLMRPNEFPKHKVVEPLTEDQKASAPGDQSQGTATTSVVDEQPAILQATDPLTLPIPQENPPATEATATSEPEAQNAPPAFSLPPAPTPTPMEVNGDTTLIDIEKTVHSPHLEASPIPSPTDGLDSARSAVMDAINQTPYDPNRPEARADVGAQFGPPIQTPDGAPHSFDSLRLPMPPSPADPQAPEEDSSTLPPPPVPPPFTP
jgi:hypothetical protein